ncbi:MAG: trypsin-like peptidase domain-containing protein [Chloroflexi bacterium]|nr:trypsin-like peptidase domain-containing protein [Chloroflexota bacterium]
MAPTAPAQQAKAPLNLEESASALEALIEQVYNKAAPAVVNITTRTVLYTYFNQPIPQEGSGSGFFYDREGHIVTNYHVVADAQSLTVSLREGEVYPATLVGADPSTDLAVIKIEAADLPDPLPLADSTQLRVGQFVLAIGNPFGLEQTLTMGIISSLGRVIESPDGRFIGEAIQTDAAINPGNSGGPLLDLQGRVIGVNSQIISTSQSFAGIGFAVSSNTVRRVVPQLIAHGRYPHPWLGVRLLDITPERAEVFKRYGAPMPVDQGVMIVEVVPGSPADKAGLRGADRTVTIGNSRVPVGGDIITAMDGKPIRSTQELTIQLDTGYQVGDTVTVTINRQGKEMQMPVTLAERQTQ